MQPAVLFQTESSRQTPATPRRGRLLGEGEVSKGRTETVYRFSWLKAKCVKKFVSMSGGKKYMIFCVVWTVDSCIFFQWKQLCKPRARYDPPVNSRRLATS